MSAGRTLVLSAALLAALCSAADPAPAASRGRTKGEAETVGGGATPKIYNIFDSGWRVSAPPGFQSTDCPGQWWRNWNEVLVLQGKREEFEHEETVSVIYDKNLNSWQPGDSWPDPHRDCWKIYRHVNGYCDVKQSRTVAREGGCCRRTEGKNHGRTTFSYTCADRASYVVIRSWQPNHPYPKGIVDFIELEYDHDVSNITPGKLSRPYEESLRLLKKDDTGLKAYKRILETLEPVPGSPAASSVGPGLDEDKPKAVPLLR